jgi:hypothetical protein
MSAYVEYGQDLYDFMDVLDITAVIPDGWGAKFNRPPKSDERPEYPAFAVVPTRDDQEIADNMSDEVSLTYSVYIFFSYWDSGEAESNIRSLVDLVRNELAKERRKEEPLGGSYTLGFSGEWGGDETQTERFYRLDVTARFNEYIQL